MAATCLGMWWSFSAALQAQSPHPYMLQEQAVTDSVIVSKSFFLLELLDKNASFQSLVRNDRQLSRLTHNYARRVASKNLKNCSDAACLVTTLQWSDAEVTAVGDALVQLYQSQTSFRQIIPLLKQNGRYARYNSDSDTALIRNAWKDIAVGINRILDVYVAGKAPRYPLIDSISFSSKDSSFLEQVRGRFSDEIADIKDPLFYTLPQAFALQALQINGRNESARYEPLNEGLNTAPYRQIQQTKWATYSYAAILIPGAGLKEGGTGLDSMGARRCNMGAERYKKGMAPFLIVSGGHVHPYKTPYCEAMEMKKYLVEKCAIPEAAVIIEPHARHTTTNIRNAARIVYRFGMPVEKPLLVVTDARQTKGVAAIASRCMNELGVVPFIGLKQITPEDNEWYVVPAALYADPYDPLDP